MYQNDGLILAGGRNLFTYERALRDACIGMTKELSGVPTPIRSLLYDLRRDEPRRIHLLGAYPRVAFICAQNGASFSTVVRPLREMESALRAMWYRGPLPGLAEIQYRETMANERLNVWQLRLAEQVHRHIIDETRTAAFLQRDETEALIAVLDGLYHAPAMRLVA